MGDAFADLLSQRDAYSTGLSSQEDELRKRSTDLLGQLGTNKDMSRSEMVAYTLLAALPMLAGGLAGGSVGLAAGAKGAETGVLGYKGILDERKKRDDLRLQSQYESTVDELKEVRKKRAEIGLKNIEAQEKHQEKVADRAFSAGQSSLSRSLTASEGAQNRALRQREGELNRELRKLEIQLGYESGEKNRAQQKELTEKQIGSREKLSADQIAAGDRRLNKTQEFQREEGKTKREFQAEQGSLTRASREKTEGGGAMAKRFQEKIVDAEGEQAERQAQVDRMTATLDRTIASGEVKEEENIWDAMSRNVWAKVDPNSPGGEINRAIVKTMLIELKNTQRGTATEYDRYLQDIVQGRDPRIKVQTLRQILSDFAELGTAKISNLERRAAARGISIPGSQFAAGRSPEYEALVQQKLQALRDQAGGE